MTTDRYTWDQAEIIGAWPPASFAAIGINPATVRKWASRGDLTVVGIGPNGCKLYNLEQVVKHADRNRPRPLAQSA